MFIKLSHNSTTRKIKVADDASLNDVVNEIVKTFGEKAKTLNICYMDSESERITISSEEDWQVCLEEAKDANKDKPAICINLKLVQSLDSSSSGKNTVDDDSEIKEEIKLDSVTDNQPFPDTKVIEEAKKDEEIEEKVPESEVNVKVELPAPVETCTQPEDLKNNPEKSRPSVSARLGVPIEIMEFKVVHDITVNEEGGQENKLNDSRISTLTTEQKDEIEELVKQKVNEILQFKKAKKTLKNDRKKVEQKENKKVEKNMQKKEKEELQKKEKEEPKQISIEEKKEAAPKKDFVHWGVTCDGCKKAIKNMARFKSLVRPDFDLCEECEKTGMHPEPMVKYSTPSAYSPSELNMKFSHFSREFAADDHQSKAIKHHSERPTATVINHPCPAIRKICYFKPIFDGEGQRKSSFSLEETKELRLQPIADLIMGVYDQIVKDFGLKPIQPQTKKEESNQKTNEKVPSEKKASRAFELAREFVHHFPHFAGHEIFISTIIREKNFTTLDEVCNYFI